MKKLNKKLDNENGSALVIVMMVLVVVSALGGALGMVTINSHRLANHTQDSNSAYYIAEAGANMAYGELETKVYETYSQNKASSTSAFFTEINNFMYQGSGLDNREYYEFSEQNGQKPKAEIKISEKNLDGDKMEYIIESKGIIGSSTRKVRKTVVVSWYDQSEEDTEVLPFPLPPLGTVITFAEKINYSGNETTVIGDIKHGGTGTTNISNSSGSKHEGDLITDDTTDLSKYTVDLSGYKPSVIIPTFNIAEDIPKYVFVSQSIPTIENQLVVKDNTKINISEDSYIPSIEKKWGESLDIYIPDQEVYLIVDKLVLGGLNKINIIGNGKLNLVVRNNLTMSYDLKINQDKPTEKLNLIYNGTNQLNFPVKFKYSGNIFSSNSSINIGYNSSINGSLLSENGNITTEDEVKITGDIMTKKGKVKVGYGTDVSGNIFTNNGEIKFLGANKITGNIHTGWGNISFAWDSSGNEKPTVNGNIITNNGEIKIGGNSLVNGDIMTKEGKVEVGYGTDVSGNIFTNNGEIKFLGANKITGNIHTGWGNISFAWDSSGNEKPTVNGNIITNNGEIKIGGNSLVNGVVMSDGGAMEIGQNTTLNGVIFTNGNDLSIGEKTTINGALIAGEGNTKFTQESKVYGTIVSKNITFGYRERIEYSEEYLNGLSFKPNPGENGSIEIDISDIISSTPATEN